MRMLWCAFMLTVAGCVLPGDLQDLKYEQELYRREVEANLGMVKSGQMTQDEALEQVAEAQRRYDEAVDRKAAEITERTEAAIAAVKDGAVDITTLLTGSGGLTALGVVALNLLRNSTRRRELAQLKEQVKG